MFLKQFRIHAVLIVVCIFIILYPLYNKKTDPEKTEQAALVATEFLQLVDSGKYAESWQSSASLMREKVKQQDWVANLTKARELSGALVKRERKSASYSTEAKDSPVGEYILLTYDATFKKEADVTEYVTVMLDDGRWKVAGYFMQ